MNPTLAVRHSYFLWIIGKRRLSRSLFPIPLAHANFLSPWQSKDTLSLEEGQNSQGRKSTGSRRTSFMQTILILTYIQGYKKRMAPLTQKWIFPAINSIIWPPNLVCLGFWVLSTCNKKLVTLSQKLWIFFLCLTFASHNSVFWAG